jgi:hypothetical protein
MSIMGVMSASAVSCGLGFAMVYYKGLIVCGKNELFEPKPMKSLAPKSEVIQFPQSNVQNHLPPRSS